MFLTKEFEVNISRIHDTMEDKTMNRVQLLSLSMLLLVSSAVFAQQGDPVVVPAAPAAPAPAAPAAPAPANPAPAKGWFASAKDSVVANATSAKNAVWTDRKGWQRALEVLGVAGVTAFVLARYTKFGKEAAEKAKAQGEKFAESLKNNKKTQIITGSVAGTALVIGAAEYFNYGPRAAFNWIKAKCSKPANA